MCTWDNNASKPVNIDVWDNSRGITHTFSNVHNIYHTFLGNIVPEGTGFWYAMP